MENITYNLEQLESLIDRYFDATASEAEEKLLRKALVSTKLSSPKIDEARAVMGFFSIERQMQKQPVVSHSGPYRVAATIAISLICAATLFFSRNRTENICIAYIGQNEITNSNEVLSMFQQELDALSEANIEVRTDLGSQLSTLANELSF